MEEKQKRKLKDEMNHNSDSPWQIEIYETGDCTRVMYEGKVLDSVTAVEVGIRSATEAASAKIEIEMPSCIAVLNKDKVTLDNKERFLSELKSLVEMGLLSRSEIDDRLK